MPLRAGKVDSAKFNKDLALPYQLRLADFELAMQDVYDFFHDVNGLLLKRGLHRLDDMLRPAAMSGMVSDMLTAAMAKHARALVENKHFNGHPDLVVQGIYSPTSDKPWTVASTVLEKADIQAPNVVVNLGDSTVESSDVIQLLQENDLSKVNSVYFIKNDSIIVFRPR